MHFTSKEIKVWPGDHSLVVDGFPSKFWVQSWAERGEGKEALREGKEKQWREEKKEVREEI